MKPTYCTPRSQSAIKALAAKQRASNSAITQSQALDNCSREAGYSNWTHARRFLPEKMKLVRISAPWFSGWDKTAGIETMAYPLPWTAQEIVGSIPEDFETSRTFSGGLINGLVVSDTAKNEVTTGRFPNRELARKTIVRVLRELMFIEATGFRFQISDGSEFDLPGSVYFTRWLDPITGTTVILDEPKYKEGIDFHLLASAREAWCCEHGYQMLRTKWRGTLANDSLPVALLAPRVEGPDLNMVEAQLTRIADDFSRWTGKVFHSLSLSHRGWGT